MHQLRHQGSVCAYGDKCKYEHIKAPGPGGPRSNREITCYNCDKKGHTRPASVKHLRRRARTTRRPRPMQRASKHHLWTTSPTPKAMLPSTCSTLRRRRRRRRPCAGCRLSRGAHVGSWMGAPTASSSPNPRCASTSNLPTSPSRSGRHADMMQASGQDMADFPNQGWRAHRAAEEGVYHA